MKYLMLLTVFFLTGCASTDEYNNEQIRTQCPIGYHEEYSKPITVYKTKEGNKVKTQDDFRCVPD